LPRRTSHHQLSRIVPLTLSVALLACNAPASTDPTQDTAGEVDPTDLTGAANTQDTAFVLQIQPIQVSRDDGSSPANPERRLFEDIMDKVFLQADLDIEYLPWVEWSSTRAWDAPLVQGDIDWAEANAPVHEDATVANMVFINTIDAPNQTGGLSRTPGRVMFIADWGLDATLHLLPHELGHNLGLDHTTLGADEDAMNLMSADLPGDISDIFPDGGGYLHLTQDQLDQISQSTLVKPRQ